MVLDDDVVLGQVLDVRRGRAGAGVTAAMTTRPTDRRTDGRTQWGFLTIMRYTNPLTHSLTHAHGWTDRRTDGRGSDDSCTEDYEPSIRWGARWRHLRNTIE